MLIVDARARTVPSYRVGFNNFYVITRYNRSTMYAMAVHDLGEAVAGAFSINALHTGKAATPLAPDGASHCIDCRF